MSGLIYERGDPAQPVGHAFLYFGHRGDQEVVATYIVIPPITMDIAKYMPPMFASTFGANSALVPQANFLPIPPVPESMELPRLLGMAELRGDDILVAGPRAPEADPSTLLTEVVEIAEAYANAYQASLRSAAPAVSAEAVSREEADSPHVRAMMYATVSERDRLESLARELGTIRYGMEVGDSRTVETSLGEMRVIAASLPGKFKAQELVEVAARSDSASVRLTQLYLERGYRLCREAYEELPPIEAEIALLQHEIERPS
jgi:hypothetical protein